MGVSVKFLTAGYDSLVYLKLAYIPLLWFINAQNTKRCHDLGKNGWHQLLPEYLIRLLFCKGEKGANEFREE